MTAASAKQRAMELLWIVGAAAMSLALVSLAIWFSTNLLGVDIDELVEAAIGVLAAIGGGAWGLQAMHKQKGD